MIELIISFSIFGILLALNKKARELLPFLILILTSAFLMFVIVFYFNLNYETFILPCAYLIIFQPLRLIFIKLKKREPIVYIRGMQLTPQEEEDFSYEDSIFASIVFFTPLLLLFIIII